MSKHSYQQRCLQPVKEVVVAEAVHPTMSWMLKSYSVEVQRMEEVEEEVVKPALWELRVEGEEQQQRAEVQCH